MTAACGIVFDVKMGPLNSSSIKWSCVLHGVLLTFAMVLPLIPACAPKELNVPSDFTVVLEENLVPPNVPPDVAQAPETKVESAPEEVSKADEAMPEPEAAKPEELPDPPRDSLVIEKKKPPEKKKEPEKKKAPEKKAEPEKKPEKKKDSEKKKEPEKKPFVRGKRVDAPTSTASAQPSQDFTKLKPVTTAPLTDKKLSRGEIERALRDGARAGTQNMIPEDEMSRCVLLVKRALYDSWEQPGAGDAGTRPTLLDIQLDPAGRVVGYHIRQSSGSPTFDQTVLKAAAKAPVIRGLSLAFLQKYETLTVEFKLE